MALNSGPVAGAWIPATAMIGAAAMLAAWTLADPPATPPASQPPPSTPASQDAAHSALHNLLPVADRIWSGAVPEGAAAFDKLQAMGIRTIISVDGARPDVEAAKARGLRYVHLPVGYDGLTRAEQLHVARAVRDLEGPVYIHCHHGKHRGPTAAASAAVALGLLTPEQSVAFMQQAGTAPSYAGLYSCVAGFGAPAAADEIDAASDDFPEVATVSGLVAFMVEADHALEHLKLIRDAGWQAPSDHPDLVPAAEAGRLVDALRLLMADEEIRDDPPEFHELLAASQAAARALEDALTTEPLVVSDLDPRFEALAASCKACHVKYRD